MTNHTTHKHLARTALRIGLAAAAMLIAACSSSAGTTPVARNIPPIDAARPARTETATFALG